MSSHANGVHLWLFVLALLALVLVGECVPVKPSHALKRVFTEPVVVKNGESIPYHPIGDISEEGTLEDGLVAIGKWLQSVGLFSEEKQEVSSSLPVDEPFELDLGRAITHADLHTASRRESFAPESVSTTPSFDTIPPACSGRGVLMNKTGIVVRNIYSQFLLI